MATIKVVAEIKYEGEMVRKWTREEVIDGLALAIAQVESLCESKNLQGNNEDLQMTASEIWNEYGQSLSKLHHKMEVARDDFEKWFSEIEAED